MSNWTEWNILVVVWSSHMPSLVVKHPASNEVTLAPCWSVAFQSSSTCNFIDIFDLQKCLPDIFLNLITSVWSFFSNKKASFALACATSLPISQISQWIWLPSMLLGYLGWVSKCNWQQTILFCFSDYPTTYSQPQFMSTHALQLLLIVLKILYI